MNTNAQGYSGAPQKLLHKEYRNKLYIEAQESSVVKAISKCDEIKTEDLLIANEVTYPILVNDYDDMRMDGAFQANGRSEELSPNWDKMTFTMCGSWKGHMKLELQDWQRMKMDGSRQLFVKSVSAYINNQLDVRRDAMGLAKIAMSANINNIGRNAGGGLIDLGDLATPLAPVNGEQLNTIINRMISTVESHDSVNPKKADWAVVVNPVMAGMLRQVQGITLNTQTADKNTLVTGIFRNVYGVEVITSNRVPYTFTGGLKVFNVILVDKNIIGAPFYEWYIKREEKGHDMTLYFSYSFDTHVLNNKGVSVARVVAQSNGEL